MAAEVLYEQYRPLTTLETGKDDTMSVRAMRDMAESLNNAKNYAMNHKVRRHIAIPHLETPLVSGTETTEQIILMFAPVYVPDGFSLLRWQIGYYRSTGAGEVTFKVYCHARQYRGPRAINTSLLSDNYQYGESICGSDTHTIPAAISTKLSTDANRMAWILVTSTASDATTKAKLTGLEIIPFIVPTMTIIDE